MESGSETVSLARVAEERAAAAASADSRPVTSTERTQSGGSRAPAVRQRRAADLSPSGSLPNSRISMPSLPKRRTVSSFSLKV